MAKSPGLRKVCGAIVALGRVTGSTRRGPAPVAGPESGIASVDAVGGSGGSRVPSPTSWARPHLPGLLVNAEAELGHAGAEFATRSG